MPSRQDGTEMGEDIQGLKRRVYRLVGEFSNAFMAAAVALNMPPVAGRVH